MKLEFIKKHKSIYQLESEELPSFIVLTGLNGSGKSHLLEAIENGSISVDGQANDPHYPQNNSFRMFTWNTLVPQNMGNIHMGMQRTQHWDVFRSLIQQIETEQSPLWSQVAYLKNNPPLVSNDDDLKVKMNNHLMREPTDTELMAIKNVINQLNQVLEPRFQSSLGQQVGQGFYSNLKEQSPCDLIFLSQEQFTGAYPRKIFSVDPFQYAFNQVFSVYVDLTRQNFLKKIAFNECKRGNQDSFLSNEEFVHKYGEAPWNIVNEILQAAKLDFEVPEPKFEDDAPIDSSLRSRSTGENIQFSDLSSGEKIIVSFALCLFHTNNKISESKFPTLILFDEIDATLHPSMTQSILDTIQKILVERYNVKVIMTTHSPTTVALSPEESVYGLRKEGGKKIIEKKNRDQALSILTQGIPFLSIDYSKRKQVFVESENDAETLGAFYEILRSRNTLNNSGVSLSFIASGFGKKTGACQNVIEFTKKFRKNGNSKIFGLIDYDNKNEPKDNLFVLGERYTIENFIYDPLIIGALLIREDCFEAIDLGLPLNTAYTELKQLAVAQRQSLFDAVWGKIKPPTSSSECTKTIEIEYVGNFKITADRTVLSHNWKHECEDLLKEKFPKLMRFNNSKDLTRYIVEMVYQDFHEWIPLEFQTIFNEIIDA